jgi:uncharacterized membrane protein YccC
VIDYIKEYQKFTTSYYLTEGLRITSAVMIPVLISAYFDQLSMGTAFALGTMCVSLSDNPGPLHHRQNGMNISIVLIFITAIITGFSVAVPWLLAIELLLFSFVFSMIGVYGARASSVGMATLFVMVLNIDDSYTSKEVLINAALVMLGGCWYFFWSLLLHRIRPYKLAQQAIGDCILSTASYLRIKASLYDGNVNYEKSYKALLEEQVQLHNKQDLVREIVFKTRSIVKESTNVGRILLATFVDSVDIFERIMTSQRDYKALHVAFDNSVLNKFKHALLQLANELDAIGIAVQKGEKSFPSAGIAREMESLESFVIEHRSQHMNDNNVNDYTGLKHILDSIKDVYNRIEILHRYTSYDKTLAQELNISTDYSQFVSPTELNPKLFADNLNLESNIFRHSIRVAVAIFASFILSKFLPVGHSYWILLTVLVILKPAYSLTRQRNIQRLAGTFIGAAVGGLILYLIKDSTVLVVILILCMAAAYSLMRLQYLLCVICMTTYLLIAFYFLKPVNFSAVVADRVVDTAVGSIVAFLITLIIPPKWEHEQIRNLLQETIKANIAYYRRISSAFTGKSGYAPSYKLSRKEVYVSLANLSDAFQRMLSEPRSKQKNSALIYQLVVSNHLLTSHVATLSSYIAGFAKIHASEDFEEIIHKTIYHLQQADSRLDEINEGKENTITKSEDGKLGVREKLQYLMQKRLQELEKSGTTSFNASAPDALRIISDQFEYIYKISLNIEKEVLKMNAGN